MTYFEDLSPYGYGSSAPSERVVHVGWLSNDHRFPIATPSPELVDALLRCCFRPVELYRGYHVCDLCPGTHDMLTVEFRGRRVSLGNGEVRATDADGIVYAAPTLVAHYVAVHDYRPPDAFVAGVQARAASLDLVLDDEAAELRTLGFPEHFERGLQLFEEIAMRSAPAWAEAALSALRGAAASTRGFRKPPPWIESSSFTQNASAKDTRMRPEPSHLGI